MAFDIGGPKVAIVGATGAVGREILSILEERGMQFKSLDLLASPRSAGRTIEAFGAAHTVFNLEDYDFAKADIAFFSAGGAVSKAHAPRAAEAGTLVIDNTNAFRMDPEVPLVVPQVNRHALKQRKVSRIVANPNCSTIQMVRAVGPIDRALGIKRLFCATYQAASGGGLTGMDELLSSTSARLEGRKDFQPKKFPSDIGFNAIPQIDVFLDGGMTLEEQKMRQETRKILDRPDIGVEPFAVRVPVMNGHCVAVVAECRDTVDLGTVRAALAEDPDILVHGINSYPNIHDVSGKDTVHVARLHGDAENPRQLYFWVAADNLRVGAALNAVQIAEAALELALV
ncbi:MAG: aspartate-semialdehyde dehydrogenase [Albidovulum sp.]|uniref:aspartate-semialdehyde dehydrogenase n=1 Tax=Albidovulum sp. TaxID=1872424 RepID=UPI003C971A1B